MSKSRASISALELSRSHPVAENRDRIGPNAVIQLVAALKTLGETDAMSRLFQQCGREAWLDSPPEKMIPASDAARLHVGLRGVLPEPRAAAALAMAGGLTADYLLANRIPGFARAVFRILPARLSAWALMRLISAHAWTFAGSGVFSFDVGSGAQARIRENPLCSGLRTEAPACVWHAAVFEGLFRALVSPSSRAQEIACRARGDDCCRFRLDWAGGTATRSPRHRVVTSNPGIDG